MRGGVEREKGACDGDGRAGPGQGPGSVTPFPGFQRDTHRDTLQAKPSICCLYLVLILTAKRVRSRVNRMRTGCCGGRRFSVASAHCPQRPGAATHVRKTRAPCSLSALRRVAGELALNRARSVPCDGGTGFIAHSGRARRLTRKSYRCTPLTTRIGSLRARA